jgi:hypothetical protein
MLVRLLLAVLTLVGAVPLRICTCGAAHLHQATPTPSGEPQAPGVHTDDGPVGHHHDCPALKPKPAMSLAVPASFADHTTDSTPAVAGGAFAQEFTPGVCEFVEPRSPDPPNRPLFVHVCNLRN